MQGRFSPQGGVSVVICAHNSADRIRPTLEAIARCRTNFATEVIVVDNNSSDGTAARAAEIWKEIKNTNFDFRIIEEPVAGLAYARRAGIKAASMDIVVFCDDDNWLSEDYLMQALRIMSDPQVGAAGGCGTPTRPERLPPWFYTFAWGYAVGVPLVNVDQLPEFPDTEREVSSVWGAGIVVRRDAMAFLFSLPGFPTLSGRKGGEPLSGEDLEICACLACAGYKIVFSSVLQFRHDIAPERLDPIYVKRLFANFNSGFEMLGHYRMIMEARSHPVRAVGVGVARITKHALLGKLNRNSFLSLLAALGAAVLLTRDQRSVFGTVQQIRARRIGFGDLASNASYCPNLCAETK